MKYVLHQMLRGPRLKVDMWRGDEAWKASVHVEWKWRGKHWWFVLFLPEWLMK